MGAAAAAVVLATAGAAGATVSELQFAGPGPQPQIYFNGFVPGTTTLDTRLSATLDLTLTSVTAGGYQWNFSYNLANTSTIASRIGTIGWDVAPDFLSVIGVDGVFANASAGAMASLGSKDVCLKDGGGANCSGGGGGGLAMGQSGSGVFSLTFLDHTTSYITIHTPRYNKQGKVIGYVDSQLPQLDPVAAPTSVAFNNFGLHLQSLDGGLSTVGVASSLITAQGGGLGNDIHDAVPEPATWGLMILGFGAVGAALRRRRTLLAH